MKKAAKGIAAGIILAGLGALVAPAIAPRQTPPIEAGRLFDLKERLAEKGVEETGSINLVSSIYLGYRAFDTLGETIVLVLSVNGVLALMGRKK